ncbi:hypothetical protein ACFX2F_017322 [Malus domestica]
MEDDSDFLATINNLNDASDLDLPDADDNFLPLPILCSALLLLTRSANLSESESRNWNAGWGQFIRKSPLLCSTSLALTRPDKSTQSQQKEYASSRHDEERVLISEVLVRDNDKKSWKRMTFRKVEIWTKVLLDSF